MTTIEDLRRKRANKSLIPSKRGTSFFFLFLFLFLFEVPLDSLVQTFFNFMNIVVMFYFVFVSSDSWEVGFCG